LFCILAATSAAITFSRRIAGRSSFSIFFDMTQYSLDRRISYIWKLPSRGPEDGFGHYITFGMIFAKWLRFNDPDLPDVLNKKNSKRTSRKRWSPLKCHHHPLPVRYPEVFINRTGELRGYRSAVFYFVVICLFEVEPDHGRQYLCSRGIFYSPEPPTMTTTGIDQPLSRSLPISSRFGTRK
jgi:hypothetical protein